MRRVARFVAISLVLLVGLAPMAASADHDVFFQTPGFNAQTAYGDPVTLAARLLEDDDDCHPGPPCPESGKQVDFYVDGEYVGTDITNSGGYAYLLITAMQKWHVGAHEIRAQYDRRSPPAIVISTLTILQETTVITARDGYLEARLLDNDNVPVTGQAVTFWLVHPLGETELCTAFTDFDGIARCIPVTGAGVTPIDSIDYRAEFKGTGDYVLSSDNAKLI